MIFVLDIGSGRFAQYARSINIDDCMRNIGITDFSTIDANYGNKITKNSYYIDENTENKITREPINVTDTYTYYAFSPSNYISNEKKIFNLLFNSKYVLASTCVKTTTDASTFWIRVVENDKIYAHRLLTVTQARYDEGGGGSYIRPVVVMQNNITVADKNSSEEWVLKYIEE